MVAGMSVQLTIRLPDDLAAFVDQQVAQGDDASRATVIADALRRCRRQLAVEDEIRIVEEIHARGEDLYPDLDGWVRSADFTDLDDV